MHLGCELVSVCALSTHGMSGLVEISSEVGPEGSSQAPHALGDAEEGGWCQVHCLHRRLVEFAMVLDVRGNKLDGVKSSVLGRHTQAYAQIYQMTALQALQQWCLLTWSCVTTNWPD